MNLSYAATEESTGRAALNYAWWGLSVIPLNGKISTGKWTFATERPMTVEQAAQIWTQHPEYNVGIVCGKVSGLVVLDFDGLSAYALFARVFPDLTETFTVLTGSQNGKHVYLRPQEMPDNRRVMGLNVGNIELRTDGSYVVAAPSIHPVTNQPYRVDNPAPVLEVANLNDLVAWLDSLKKQSPPAQPKRPQSPPVHGVPLGKVRYPRAYALSALRKECDLVAAAVGGARNTTLNQAAYNLGQLVSVGWLNRMEVEAALSAVADREGQPANEIEKTIASGLKAGMEADRITQWTKR